MGGVCGVEDVSGCTLDVSSFVLGIFFRDGTRTCS